MTCYLWVAGKEFDVDTFLKGFELEVADVSHIGKPKYPAHPDKMIAKLNGFRLDINNAGFSDVKTQIKECTSFLEKNFDKLKDVKSYLGVEYANIMFGSEFVWDKFELSIYYPPELIRLAGELGFSIEVSIYNDEMIMKDSK